MSSDEDDSYGEPTKAEFDEYQINFSKTGILHVTVDAIEAGDSDTLTFGRWRGGNPRWIIYSRETKHSAERNPFYGKLIHGDVIINLNNKLKFSSTTKWEYDNFKYMMELATKHESTWTIFRPLEYSVIVAKDDRCWEDGLPFEYSAETRKITTVYHGSETRGNKNLWDLLLKMSIGDIITKINGTPVTLYSSEELIEAMNKTKGDFVLHLQKASKGASCDKDLLEELEDKVTELENEILEREYDDTDKDEILHLTEKIMVLEEKIMVLEKENDELRRSLTNYYCQRSVGSGGDNSSDEEDDVGSGGDDNGADDVVTEDEEELEHSRSEDEEELEHSRSCDRTLTRTGTRTRVDNGNREDVALVTEVANVRDELTNVHDELANVRDELANVRDERDKLKQV